MFQYIAVAALASALLGYQLVGDDLTEYRVHKPIKIAPTDKDRTRKEAEVRSFIWDNWVHHHRAYILRTAYSKEGERSVFEFFVEPDSEGTWRVRVRADREIRLQPPANVRPENERVEFACTTLERVDPPAELLHALTVIPTTVDRPPSLYRLHPGCGQDRNLPTLW